MKKLFYVSISLVFFVSALVAIPLFDAYPKFKEKIPYIKLGNFPTPIHKLENLGAVLQTPQLYIKQDGLSGGLFGGNKVRKLEFLLGAAVASNASGVITTGGAGSNHVLATAVYANKLGLLCYALLNPQFNTAYLRRNLLLMHHYGARLEYCKTKAAQNIGAIALNEAYKEAMGHSLFLIPRGGSDELGAVGFVNAAFELKQQIEGGVMPEPDLIYISRGTMGSSVGLMLGLKAAGLKSRVVPIADEPYEDPLTPMIEYFNKTAAMLHDTDITFPQLTLTVQDLDLFHGDFSGKFYAEITPAAADAIKLLYNLENIKLEATYTGKTLAALLHDVKTKDIKEKVILFWNTYCSGDFADITSTTDYKQLPSEFHVYFERKLHPLDQGA